MTSLRVLGLCLVVMAAVAASVGCSPPKARCSTANCAGCCALDGTTCSAGDQPTACGKGGLSCFACLAGQSCSANGFCGTGGVGGGNAGTGGGGTGGGTGGGAVGGGSGGGTASCGPANCADGCCNLTTCVRGGNQTNQLCGSGGTSCLQCVTGNTCTNGSCLGTASCNPTTCATGCCQGNSCLPIAQQGSGSCGANGVMCTACGSGQMCQSGVCGSQAVLGGSCVLQSDCASLGGGAYCKLQTSTGNALYPSGYCTVPCTTPGQVCGGGLGTCIGGPTWALQYYGEADQFCAANCPVGGERSTCRQSYLCYGDTAGGYCFLETLPDFDGGGSPDKLGEACTTDTQCQNPPGPTWGGCLKGTTGDGGPSGFSAGYCIADCTYDNTGSFCGTKGECFDFTTDPQNPNYLCLRTCSTPGGGKSTLRPNGTYVCRTTTGPDGGTLGYLWPSCTNPGRTCPSTYGCNTTSGYCCDAGRCLN